MQCNYFYNKGKNKGKQCNKHPYKNAKYCSDHKDTSIAKHGNKEEIQNNAKNKLANDNVFSEDVNKPKQKQNKSTFLCTFNSNKVIDSLTDDDKKEFKKFISFIFNESNITDFLMDRTSTPTEVIDNMKIDYQFELSSDNRLHAHAYLDIDHHGCLTIRLNDIRELARKVLGYNIYVDCRIAKDPAAAWKNYINKNSIKI